MEPTRDTPSGMYVTCEDGSWEPATPIPFYVYTPIWVRVWRAIKADPWTETSYKPPLVSPPQSEEAAR